MRFVAVLLLALAASPISQAQTVDYTYDALGRLTKAAPSSGNAVDYYYDAADNRASVASTGSAGSPVAVNDVAYAYYGCVGYNGNAYAWPAVMDNDYNTTGGMVYFTSVTPSNPYLVITLGSGGNRGGFTYVGPPINPSPLVLTYTIANSVGLTATGTVTIHSFYMDPNDC
jgi:YD repeat-containing protein